MEAGCSALLQGVPTEAHHQDEQTNQGNEQIESSLRGPPSAVHDSSSVLDLGLVYVISDDV